MKYFIFIIIVLGLWACQLEDRYASKAIFRYNVAEGISSLDPAFARSLDNVSAVNHLFNGLVQTDEKLNIQPAIAKSWEIKEAGTLLRFQLRTDVYFHPHSLFGKDSSRKVVAEDFVYSFQRLVDEKLLSPGKWVMNEVERDEKGDLKVLAKNDSLLEIHLKRAFQPFLGILSMQYCAVVPKEVVSYYGRDFRSNPIGTGPFKFKYWRENGKLILLRHKNYFERDHLAQRLPYLDAISISFLKDQEVTFLKFLSGELDYLGGLKGSYKDELLDANGKLRPKYQGQIQFLSGPFLNTEYLGFLVDSNLLEKEQPILNPYVRKAINYGFDRKKMLKYLRNGIGFPAEQGFIPKGLPAFTKELHAYSYQPDSVKEMLKKAGFPKGQDLAEIKLHTTGQYQDICEYLQSSLSDFGIKIKVLVNQAATNNQLIANGRVAFFRKSWVADYPDAENYLSLFRSDNFAPGGPNYTHYQNHLYDRWYEKAMNTIKDSLRYVYYQKMDSTIMADAAVVPLFYDQVVRFIHPEISGIGVNPMNLLLLKYAKKEPYKNAGRY